jgi:hypothetical protein
VRERGADARDGGHGSAQALGKTVLIGDDVADRKPASRAQDSMKLGKG